MSKDRCIGIFFLLVSGVLWFWLIPSYTRGPAEAAYPRFVAFLMFVPAVAMLFRKATPENTLHLPTFDLQKLLRAPFMRTLLLIISYAIYIKCVEIFGFYTSGFVFCIGWMLFLGERAVIRVLLTPLLVLGIMYVFITVVLRYPLPAGILL